MWRIFNKFGEEFITDGAPSGLFPNGVVDAQAQRSSSCGGPKEGPDKVFTNLCRVMCVIFEDLL
jgi:hypothetical protein